jgi:hypothetical protein
MITPPNQDIHHNRSPTITVAIPLYKLTLLHHLLLISSFQTQIRVSKWVA